MSDSSNKRAEFPIIVSKDEDARKIETTESILRQLKEELFKMKDSAMSSALVLAGSSAERYWIGQRDAFQKVIEILEKELKNDDHRH